MSLLFHLSPRVSTKSVQKVPISTRVSQVYTKILLREVSMKSGSPLILVNSSNETLMCISPPATDAFISKMIIYFFQTIGFIPNAITLVRVYTWENTSK